MNKIILAVSALIASLALFIGLLSVTLDETERVKGSFESALVATSTGTMYSHQATGTRTATSTLQNILIESVSEINLGTGSTTQFIFVPNGQGTTSVAYSFKSPAGIREVRFRAWSQ